MPQVAYSNKMDVSLRIAIGPGLQIALFEAPVLVLVSVLLRQPMTVVDDSFDRIALVGAFPIAVLISRDGESNWLEGAELMALYAILGIAFFFVP